jgi:hypothetical protein
VLQLDTQFERENSILGFTAMMIENRIKGYWWLPDNQERQLPGEMQYGLAFGATLDIYDYFFEDGDGRHYGERFTVWGVTVQGQPVTLFNCYTLNLSISIPGARSARLSSIFAVIGGHYRSPEEIRLTEVRVELSYLHQWLWRRGIILSRLPNENGTRVDVHTPPSLFLGEFEGFRFELTLSQNITDTFERCEILEKCYLDIISSEPRTFDDFGMNIRRFQQFLALAVCRPVYVLSTKGKPCGMHEATNPTARHTIVEIIYKTSLRGATDENLTPEGMLFSLSDVCSQPNSILRCFFEKYDRLQPVCDSFFITLYNLEMSVQQQFLMLAAGIEAYHRAFKGGKYQEDEEYNQGLLQRFLSAIPELLDNDFKASLKIKLKYLHEFSLRKRVQDVCIDYQDLLHPFLGDIPAFALQVAKIRNQLTHQDVTSSIIHEPLDIKSLWLISEKLNLLQELCLLHELGFSEEVLPGIIRRSQHARRIYLNT